MSVLVSVSPKPPFSWLKYFRGEINLFFNSSPPREFYFAGYIYSFRNRFAKLQLKQGISSVLLFIRRGSHGRKISKTKIAKTKISFFGPIFAGHKAQNQNCNFGNFFSVCKFWPFLQTLKIMSLSIGRAPNW
jgi:hypothetical protein